MVMKIISSLHDWISAPAVSGADASADRLRDPLAHPAIQAMSQREIADLPLHGTRHLFARSAC